MSDPFATNRAGQSLLNAELYNGLAAKDAENHAIKMGQIYSGNSGSTSELKKKVQDLEADRNRISAWLKGSDAALLQSDAELSQYKSALAQSEETIKQRDASIVERDATLMEWMLQAEVCRRLVKTYGKAQDLPSEKVSDDYDQELMNVVEECPQYAATKLSKKSSARKS